MPRTSPTSLLFTSYNLLDLFAGDTAEDEEHYEMITGVIRSLGTDVLAVQEILAADADTAARRLRQLADDAGLRCEVPGAGGGRNTALAFGGHGYHVGLMWRDGIEPVPGSLRCYGGRDFWHGLAVVTLDVGGTLIRHGAFHATPFSRGVRADQNARLVAAITRPEGQPPALVGADWNTECADRILACQTWELYEPADPYAGVDWFADLIYQCQWDYDELGRRRHWADRRPGDVLWAGGLHDAAAGHRRPLASSHSRGRRSPPSPRRQYHVNTGRPLVNTQFPGNSVTVSNRPFCDAGPMRTEESRNRGPCRFARCAVVEGLYNRCGAGVARRRGHAEISQHSCWPKDAPALDDLRPAGPTIRVAAE